VDTLTTRTLLGVPSSTALDLAEGYERRTSLFDGWRDRVVDRLGLRSGDTVLDVGCGPGTNLDALQRRVGPLGRIVAFEKSPELLEVARYRVARRGWRNVELMSGLPTGTDLPRGAHAALFCAADDVLGSPTRLAYLVSRLRPGARVAAGGWQLPRGWGWPLRAYVMAHYGPLVSDPAALERPWRMLSGLVPSLKVREFGFGTGYLAHGVCR
jgi:SAM-dependent methyltransferase